MSSLVEEAVSEFETAIAPLERIIEIFAASLEPPKMYMLGTDRGYRYVSPDVRHFCLLKAVRVVSALNASITLMRGGYVQELAVLMRTLIECSTHIEFVLGREPSGEHRSAVKKYVTDFFADFQRDPSVELRRAQVPQGLVNRTLGQTLDRFADEIGESTDRTPAEKLFSNSYRILSNYVHAKYPEAMDLYGGRPGRFHLRGMSNTPKDIESIETLRTFVRTAWTTFKYMILEIDGLATLVLRDPELLNWYSQFSEGV